jgi:hypothetical protein
MVILSKFHQDLNHMSHHKHALLSLVPKVPWATSYVKVPSSDK